MPALVSSTQTILGECIYMHNTLHEHGSSVMPAVPQDVGTRCCSQTVAQTPHSPQATHSNESTRVLLFDPLKIES